MAIKQSLRPQYTLNPQGEFIINDYNQAKPFSNFFPGIAGIWGIPMWVFYVNRGQCIASFGVESKDKAIMEFQPANKSYRLTSLQGFRTFIKVSSGSNTVYWEPFQSHLSGTDFQKQQTMSMSAHDLTLREANLDLGLTIEVNYFTLPEEPFSALVRRVTIKNNLKRNYDLELLDGLPAIVPYGLTDGLNKNIARTVEAWVAVRNLEHNAPYYQLNVEVSDRPQVVHIDEGNFFFSFDPNAKKPTLLQPVVEGTHIFGESCDFLAPAQFLDRTFKIPKQQQTNNRTPTAMSHDVFTLRPNRKKEITSLFGYADSEKQLNKITSQVIKKNFIDQKAQRNKDLIDGIKDMCLTNSSSHAFDLYSSQTFLDNILRGGLPVSLQTGEGAVSLNVYSRKHGDLERDYNFFFVAPTFYSQGNGNYRDVNQNRRNDTWFNKDVKETHLISFLSLSQVDGYNPLVVKGTAFAISDAKKLNQLLSHCIDSKDREVIKEFLKSNFTPGELLKFISVEEIHLTVSSKEFLTKILAISQKQELADHGEGFWSDHWTYNMDLLESYFSIYPENLKTFLIDESKFHFYQNAHYVLPRNHRYILTDRGVRQYASVKNGSIVESYRMRTKNGQGDVYYTNLVCKILCLLANKVASLDPSGIGVEMEADKPNWYDALNGLPGLLGSSVSETFEVKRLSQFLLNALNSLELPNDQKVAVFEELVNFISGLTDVLSAGTNALEYWKKSNDFKEHYRESVRQGIDGIELNLSIAEIKNFLELVIAKTEKGIQAANDSDGFLATYFTHQVTEHKKLRKGSDQETIYVEPLKFKKHALPLFLEGYVHALRVADDLSKARQLYDQVRRSKLYDKKLKMYKVNSDLSNESEEIGRTRIFPKGWLENESIWLHMEYKFLLELIRKGLYEEFYINFKNILIPFLDPEQYGRSVLENSSFIVSSAHEDNSLHGRGYVARLSGSTAEFVHVWLLMNVGQQPFTVNSQKQLEFSLKPALAGWLFTTEETTIDFQDLNGKNKKVKLPENTYAFNLFGSTLIVYHNPKRHNTYGVNKPSIKEMHLLRSGAKKPTIVESETITGSIAQEIRNRAIERIDVFFN